MSKAFWRSSKVTMKGLWKANLEGAMWESFFLWWFDLLMGYQHLIHKTSIPINTV